MATAPQTAMDMPQEAANPYANPDTTAIYDQMRQSVSPKEFSDEVLAGASQVDPQEVAKFKDELDKLDVPMEVLDMLNNMVDEILANPDNYEQVKQKYEAMGVTEDLLPPEFDGHFFSALNMAVDQMVAEPAGAQAFAKGGIAELKPISKAVADYGRNGDTMLAHITPAEARMLRRRGGAGTTNPHTGLKEYFSLGKLFKGIGNAIKSFASSTVGKVVTTVALGFFLGPAAASLVGATSAAGVAAVIGFVGSAGSTLLGGGNLKDALKAGAIGGLTAGAVGGATQGFDTAYQGPTTVGGQVDKFTGMFKSPPFPEYTAQAPAATPSGIQAPAISPTGQVAGMTAQPNDFAPQSAIDAQAPVPKAEPSFMDKAKTFYNENISPSGIQEQGAKDALSKVQTQFPGVTTEQIMSAPASSALGKAYAAAMPGILSTYGPMAAVGIGALGAAGGFKPTQASASTLRPELMKPVTQRIAEGGNQRNFYIQGLPGVKYDQYGAPIFGQNMPLPTFDTGLGIQSLMNPKGYADGGIIGVGYAGGGTVTAANFDSTAYLNANQDVKDAIARGEIANAYEHYTKFGQAEGRTAFDKTETAAKAATEAKEKEAAQIANRKLVDDAKAAKKAAGFGDAYKNINAGLSYDVPAGIASTSIAARQAAFKPTMDKFTQSQAANAAILAKPYTPTVVDQPYNNTTGYTNVLTSVAPPINYDTTPELTAAQKAAADKAIADKLAADKAAADAAANMTAAQKAAADKAAADKLAADKLAADKAAADKFFADAAAAAADKAAADKAAADKAAADKAAADKLAADKAAADRTLFQGQSSAVQNQQIMDYLKANPNATDQTLAQQMDYFGIKSPQVAQVVGMQDVPVSSVQNIDRRYEMAKAANAGNPFAVAGQNQANAVTGQSIRDYFVKNPGMTDTQIASYMDQNAIDPAQMQYAFAGTPGAISAPDVFARYQAATQPLPNASASFSNAARNLNAQQPPVETKLLNMGGIASLGSGGYPRRTGQISGPGTATSDSIPAMLSDGEFVMTAKAVRAAGKGDKRAGAKRMYALMNQLEKNAARG